MKRTNSGNLFRDDVMRLLEARKYVCLRERCVGRALGADYYADLFLPELNCVVSLKWQQVSGTTEQKIAHEALRLNVLLQDGIIEQAYLVLGGPPDAWTLREPLIEKLGKLINAHSELHLMRYEEFIALANRSEL